MRGDVDRPPAARRCAITGEALVTREFLPCLCRCRAECLSLAARVVLLVQGYPERPPPLGLCSEGIDLRVCGRHAIFFQRSKPGITPLVCVTCEPCRSVEQRLPDRDWHSRRITVCTEPHDPILYARAVPCGIGVADISLIDGERALTEVDVAGATFVARLFTHPFYRAPVYARATYREVCARLHRVGRGDIPPEYLRLDHVAGLAILG
jgi:hypothetical protein